MTLTLTGVQPTGDLHLGNYVGAVRPLAELAQDPNRDVYVFVADLHALNGRPDPEVLRGRSRRLVAALLACGLDRPNVRVYRQSRVPAVAALAAVLNNLTAKGLLNRAHAYKAAVAANLAAGRDPDHGVNMGLYGYPVLMAADILALDADEVPVGLDQAQHLEIAVDLAQQFARTYRPGVLREPRAVLPRTNPTLPGMDGRKMSKSYGNAIPLMAERDELRKQVRRIVTDSTPPEQPKQPDTLVALLRAFADRATVAAVEERYRTGGIGYGEVKARLADAIEAHVAPLRARYRRLLEHPDELLERRLAASEQEANRRADRTLARTVAAVGL
ncbi:MAG TPA: tryptophan--tRNA ligase [Solirubrobacter sp.]|nr:tryptophan--tRNA ligase [Solirubrobacter sp.]